MIERLIAFGFGETTCPAELPPRRRPWFLDNGAFGAWKAGTPFDGEAFRAGIARVECSGLAPDLIVAPDIVAGGMASLDFSISWVPWLRGCAPLYLAVQDGMDMAAVEAAMDDFAGVFVGGSLAWKVREGAAWVAFAHRLGKPCHIGRVGTFDRVRWAQRIGADSFDSSLPLWSEANLRRFVDGLSDDGQLALTAPHPTREAAPHER